MGSPVDERGRAKSEGPQHQVSIASAFAVGIDEVTFAEWDACVVDGGCGGYRPKDEGWGRDERPAIYVNWNDAKVYVEWLKSETGQKYRLLTESEWEYAAREGTTTAYHWGKHFKSSSARLGWKYGPKTVPVGSYAANNFGLMDMHGIHTAMFGSGWRIAGMGIMLGHQTKGMRGRTKAIATAVFIEAVPGTARRGTSVRQSAVGKLSTTGATILGSALPGRCRKLPSSLI